MSKKVREKQFDNIEDIFRVLDKHIDGDKWLKWSSEVRHPEKQLVPLKAFLRDLRCLRKNLSFKKGSVSKAFRWLAIKMEKTWALGDEMESWCEKMALKLAEVCRWVIQSLRKSEHRGGMTAWQKQIFEADAGNINEEPESPAPSSPKVEEVKEAEVEGATTVNPSRPRGGRGVRPRGGRGVSTAPKTAVSTAPVVEWEYDFDVEMLVAFRVPKGKPNAPPDVAVSTAPERGAGRLDSPLALWKDGTGWRVSGYTNEEFESMKASRGKSKGYPYDEQRGNTRLRLEPTPKNTNKEFNRNILLTSYKDDNKKWRTICQCLHNEKHGTEVLDFMKALCCKIFSGEVEEQGARALKETFLKGLTSNSHAKVASKRKSPDDEHVWQHAVARR